LRDYAAFKQNEQFIYNLNKASVEYAYYGEALDDGFYNTKFFLEHLGVHTLIFGIFYAFIYR